MVRASIFVAVVAALTVVGACSGSSGPPRTDAAAEGTPYACTGGFIVTADGGEMSAADAGTPATCVVGQTYCGISLPHPGFTGEATAECNSVPTVCAQNPTCACLCDSSRGGVICVTNCRCSETNGLVTISCEGI